LRIGEPAAVQQKTISRVLFNGDLEQLAESDLDQALVGPC
jgi:hypothetical protein